MIIPPGQEVTPADHLGTVHFVGIGGAGLSGFARILLARGIRVTGSDARESAVLAALRELGATVWVGHPAEEVAGRLAGADTVVVSTAVKDTNPEVVEAGRRGLRLMSRADALRSLTAGYRVIAVSGSHGKTTCSAMLAMALRHCGADPSFAIGGVLADTGTNAHHGTGDLFVVEADESDRSFLIYRPELAVVTNIDPDHLDMYGSAEAYRAAFDEFVGTIRPGGRLVVSVDDPGARRLATTTAPTAVGTAAGTADRVLIRTFGESVDADLRIEHVDLGPLGGTFRPVWQDAEGDVLGGTPIDVRVAGRHHIWNAAAAYLAAIELGFDDAEVRKGLSAFTGTGRRFEFKGEAGGVRVFDDYSHHPTELRVNLIAARSAAGDGRVVVCYRPLRFTRTMEFHAEFADALSMADEVVVADPTGDDPIDGIDGSLISRDVRLPAERVRYEPEWALVPGRVADRVRSGDLLLTAGAPDVAAVGPAVLRLLAAEWPLGR